MSTSDQNPPPLATPKVFIGYRRRSDLAYARLLRQDLVKEFGAEAVFRDVERIGGGEKFLPKIYAALGTCNTFLALISPGWLEEAGRLHDPADFVRMEIAAALASGVRVLPVLLNGAQMPSKKELPADIKELTAYQAEELRDTRWEDDVRNLIKVIRAPFPAPPPDRDKLRDAALRFANAWSNIAFAALPVLLLLVGYAVWYTDPTPNGNANLNVNVNGNALTPTPSPTATAVPTQTPIQILTQTPTTTPTPLAKCFREFLPEGRWTSINYGDPDARVVIRRDQPRQGPAGILLTRDEREVGAIKFRFIRHGKDEMGHDSGYYVVDQIIGPDCRLGLDIANMPTEVRAHQNYDWLDVTLGGQHYDLRLAYANETIVAIFRPKPD
jgi:hypothetical protein